MAKKNTRSRAWVFTLHDYTEEEFEKVKALECRYLSVGKEVAPSTGRPHLQGYIYFDTARTFLSMKKAIDDRVFLEAARGKADRNQEYTQKEGEFFEKGEKPDQGKRKAIEEIKEAVASGASLRDMAEIQGVNYQSLRMGQLLLSLCEKKRRFKPRVTWLYGPPGVGKTRYVYDKFDADDVHEVFGKSLQWFQGYDAHKVSIIDEVDMHTDYSMLKRLCDRYPCQVEYKGGSRQYLAEDIFLCSLMHPADVFQYQPYAGREMLRRIDVVMYKESEILDWVTEDVFRAEEYEV